jgi:hypothetical protein
VTNALYAEGKHHCLFDVLRLGGRERNRVRRREGERKRVRNRENERETVS